MDISHGCEAVLEVLRGAGPRVLLIPALAVVGVVLSVRRHRHQAELLGRGLLRLSAAILIASAANGAWCEWECLHTTHCYERMPHTWQGRVELCGAWSRGNLIVGAVTASPLLLVGSWLAGRPGQGRALVALGVSTLALELAAWEGAVRAAQVAAAWLP